MTDSDPPTPGSIRPLTSSSAPRTPDLAPAGRASLVSLVVPCLVLIGLELFQAFGPASPRSRLQAALAGAAVALVILIGGVIRTVKRNQHARRAAEARRTDELQLRALIEGLTDHALYLLDAQGRVTTWNPGAQRIKGYPAEQVIGEHFSLFFSTEDREAAVPERALEAAARRGKFELEGWRIRSDGSRFYSRAVITALRDPSNELVGFAKITRDVTERIQHEQALEQARAALAQSQKMEALGQLTGGMAHDFNNILHVIKNSLEIVQTRLEKPDPMVLKYLDIARRNTDRAASITQRLLAYARQQPLDPKVINANKLILSIGDLLRHAIGEGISVETVFSSGLWSVSVDTNQLETAILNLTINSRDAMERVGKLTIETANALLDEAYARTHTEVTPGQYVMIAVSDTGTGMSKEIASRAFDPFFTTKGAGQGTGLGLSQVFGFVKQSGGHVKIYSEPGEGTTVKLYLPRFQAAGTIVPAEPLAPHESAMGESIVIVEDHDDVRTFAVEMLTTLGYRVAAAPDAPTALQLLQQVPQVDLLFTDVGLPNGLNGRQLADAARALRPGLRVLFTTGYARNAIVHQGRLDPGVDLLLKPYTQLDLARKVRQVLNAPDQPPPTA